MIGVIGGGLTGLTLARHLGNEVTVLEKSSDSVGLCSSISEEGFTFDTGGSHIIFSKDEEVLDFMLSVLGDNIVKNRRNTKILFKDRFVKYPFENGLSDLPLEDNLECISSFLFNLVRKQFFGSGEPNNFRDCLYDVFGSGICDKYLIPYNEKIWNISTEDMNCEWVRDRLPQPDPVKLLKASLGLGSEGYVHQLHFYYPKKGGIAALPRAIEEGVKGDVVRGFEVKSVKKKRDGFVVSDGKKERVFDSLVSTIPVPELVSMIKDSVPERVRRAASDLRFNSIITVMLGVSEPGLNDFSWLYVPSEGDGLFNRVCFPFNFSPENAPEDCSSLMAEITCDYDDEVWNMKDEDLVEHVVSHLEDKGIIDEDGVVYSRVSRSKYAYVVFDQEHFENKRIVLDFVRDYGIVPCGRFSEVEYYNMDKCIRTAMETAKELKKG